MFGVKKQTMNITNRYKTV